MAILKGSDSLSQCLPALSWQTYNMFVQMQDLSAGVSAPLRTKMRRKYNLVEEPCNDWVLHIFCDPCAICQVGFTRFYTLTECICTCVAFEHIFLQATACNISPSFFPSAIMPVRIPVQAYLQCLLWGFLGNCVLLQFLLKSQDSTDYLVCVCLSNAHCIYITLTNLILIWTDCRWPASCNIRKPNLHLHTLSTLP